MPDGEPDIVNCDVVASNCPKIPGGCTSHEIIALLAPCAASITILNNDLTINVNKTISHAEMVIDNGCHGAAIFGSTGQAQLIPVAEKINLLNHLSKS